MFVQKDQHVYILPLREALFLLRNWLDLLNTLSLGTDDPGAHSISLATSANIGIEAFLLSHYYSGFP